MASDEAGKNPRRVAAGRINQTKSKGLTPAGLERLRQAALANRPWELSTGPRTPEGKARSAANHHKRAPAKSSDATREVLSSTTDLLASLADLRRSISGEAS